VTDRYEQLKEAIEQERLAEERYYKTIATQKTVSERVASGVLLTHLQLDKRFYTVGEHIELKFVRTKGQEQPHKFKVGVGCQVILEGETTRSYRATVSFKQRDKLGVIISGDGISLGDFPESLAYKVELVYDERPYRVMRAAMDSVIAATNESTVELREGIRLLAPLYIENELAEKKWSIPQHLNESQQQSVRTAITAGRMAILHGPPGTGKTTSLVALVQTLLQREKRVLVCGPSNNAVDLLAKQISTLGIRVTRLGNVTRIDDNITDLTLDEQARNHPDWNHIKKVKIEAQEARKLAGKHKRKFGQQERRNRTDMYRESRELRKWARDLEDRLISSIIDDSQVICTTLIGVSNKHIEDMHFKTVIIDEASQALEPECWNAMLKAERVILAGDHKQLSPTVKSNEANELGLGETILDRMTPHIKFKSVLNMQYRMSESILAFSNKRHYDGLLSSHPSVANHKLGDLPSVTMIDTSGCGFEEMLSSKSRSLRNEGEYFIVREHILSLLDTYQTASIGLISPYADQIRYMSQEVAEDEQLRALDMTINTIDGFQGQERDAIIISLVRSNDAGIIGFLSDERRLNVAMTRARKNLVIIGDVATLGSHQLFLDLVEHIEQHGEYRSAWEYMG